MSSIAPAVAEDPETVPVDGHRLRVARELNTKTQGTSKRRTRVVLLDGGQYAAHLPSDHPRSRAILERMFRILSSVSHPGLPKVESSWEDDRGLAGFTREYFPSHDEDWRTFFPNLTLRTLRTLLFMGARLAFTAHHLHTATRHALCDITPYNIAFREYPWGWRPGFFDLDIATPCGEICGFKKDGHITFMGTPPFVTPEQTRGQAVGPSTDEFALAVTLLSIGLRTDGFVVPGEEISQVMRRAASGTSGFPYWRLAERYLPPNVCATFERAMHHAPERRFPDCRTFGMALRGHLHTLDSDTLGRHLPARRLSDDEFIVAAYRNTDAHIGIAGD